MTFFFSAGVDNHTSILQKLKSLRAADTTVSLLRFQHREKLVFTSLVALVLTDDSGGIIESTGPKVQGPSVKADQVVR